MRGIIKNMIKVKMVNEVINRIQNSVFNSPFAELEITAKMIKTAVSVKIVPPIVIATAGILVMPNLLAIG